jgi:outer membrane immunogenic protein
MSDVLGSGDRDGSSANRVAKRGLINPALSAVLIAAELIVWPAGRAFADGLSFTSPGSAAPTAWTGIYLGLNGGYSFGASDWSDSVTGTSSGTFPVTGFVFGGTAGANYQIGALVFGVEGDVAWSDVHGAGTFTAAALCAGGCLTSNSWLATVRGRLGYAFGSVLVYGTGGMAFGDVRANFSNDPISAATETGWTAGAGIEFAFAPNWTGKVEYLFVDLSNGSCAADCAIQNPVGPALIPNVVVKFDESIARVGVNYKFGW